ncbi:conserved hypothetical protein [Xenorhabdus bovienii str. kraussei Becker Underwood]|uniref:Uncharacterized protein n=1 Tax=Xenorhabdus bovienii str. kraussei Becker Underwood TaxID=1398204 RepID=A0A077PPW2_XENBV|nr:conserved hypothetical protein [Xenorhabdus bovienii str. kraussei Becker Underwood]
MICFDLAISQIAKIGLSSLQVIYYFEILFRKNESYTLQMRLKLVSYQLSLSKNKMIYANEEC